MNDQANIRLKDIAYYRTGGDAAYILRPQSIEELAEKIKTVRDSGLPYFILGGGSNSLVMDESWPGFAICLDQLNFSDYQEDADGQGGTIHVGSGLENTRLAQLSLQYELEGLAWMNRLPGQLGGTTRMNARCYGGEIGDVISRVDTVTLSGEIKRYDIRYNNRQRIFRGYKDSLFMKNYEVIASVGFKLAKGDPEKIRALMDHCESDRIAKGQFEFPSCGCVFKNNYEVGIPSGMLLDHAGVHEIKHPRIEVNPKHANFVFNKDQATSHEILEFTFAMREGVFDSFGVWLEYEMEVLGHLSQATRSRFEETRHYRPSVAQQKKLNDLRSLFRSRFSPKSGVN